MTLYVGPASCSFLNTNLRSQILVTCFLTVATLTAHYFSLKNFCRHLGRGQCLWSNQSLRWALVLADHKGNRTPAMLSQVVVFIDGIRSPCKVHTTRLVRRKGRERNNILGLWVGNSTMDYFISDILMDCFKT